MDLMKKLIEAKKNKPSAPNASDRATKTIGSSQKAFKKLKQGGIFDK